MPQIKDFLRERLHQVKPAPALGVFIGQFDFLRPVEAGGVIRHAHFHVPFARRNFEDDGQLPRAGVRVFHRVVRGLDERELPRAEFRFGKTFLREPAADVRHGGADGGEFARAFHAEANPVLAAGGGVHAGKV